MRVLSLGAGVQSTTLYLMAVHGEIEKPDFAIFANTGWESQATYDHLAWLSETFGEGVPVMTIQQGNLQEAAMEADFSDLPFHVRGGRLKRQCTTHYKIRPLRRALRQVTREPVELWIGISLEEVHRMRESGVGWLTHAWPLIDQRMTRHDCLRWLKAHDYAIPPRSSCLGCPYHDNGYWRNLRDQSPQEWAETVRFDEAIRERGLTRIKNPIYLHRSLQPLGKVDLSTEAERGQLDLFGEECEGICGV